MAPQNPPTESNSIKTSSSSSSIISSSFTSSSSSSLTASSTDSSSTGSPSNGTSITTGPSSNNSTAHAAASKGLSSGAAAGVGIGAGLGGILLTLLAVWIYFKCTRRSRSPQAACAGNTNGAGPKDFIDKPVPAASTVAAKDDILLDRADDSQIRKYMQDLDELIHQHVENHYHGQNQGRPEDLKRELVSCGYSDRTEPSAQALSVLLSTPATRTPAIRQLIGSVIMHHIELKSDPNTSLLPGHIASFCHATLSVKRSPANEEAFSKSFSRWRCLSAALLASSPSDGETLVSDSSLRPGVIRNVQLLHNILQPFINPGTENQRAQSDNLSSIILEGAHFGVLLFSQPSVWVFGWEGKSSTGGQGQKQGLVVFPSISEVILRSGREHLRVVVDVIKEEV